MSNSCLCNNFCFWPLYPLYNGQILLLLMKRPLKLILWLLAALLGLYLFFIIVFFAYSFYIVS